MFKLFDGILISYLKKKQQQQQYYHFDYFFYIRLSIHQYFLNIVINLKVSSLSLVALSLLIYFVSFNLLFFLESQSKGEKSIKTMREPLFTILSTIATDAEQLERIAEVFCFYISSIFFFFFKN